MRTFLLASLMFGAAACGMPFNLGADGDVRYEEGELIAAPDLYRLTDSGVRCARAPCPTIRVSALTPGKAVTASNIAFPSNMPEEVRKEASHRVFTPDGLVAQGAVYFYEEENVFVLQSLPER